MLFVLYFLSIKKNIKVSFIQTWVVYPLIDVVTIFPTGSSWWTSSFLLVNLNLGVGLLNFPRVIHETGGITVSIILLLVSLNVRRSFEISPKMCVFVHVCVIQTTSRSDSLISLPLLSSQSGRLWLLQPLFVCLCECLSRFYDLCFCYFGSKFDETWLDCQNLGPIMIVHV